MPATDAKATVLPSPLMAGSKLSSSPWTAPETLTRTVVPSSVSRTNTSVAEFVSPPVRFDASEAYAT